MWVCMAVITLDQQADAVWLGNCWWACGARSVVTHSERAHNIMRVDVRNTLSALPHTLADPSHISTHLRYFGTTNQRLICGILGRAFDSHRGNHCGASCIACVLHLCSMLRHVTWAPARGGVRVRPTLAKVGRAKRSFSTGFIRYSAKPRGLAK